MFTYFGRLTVVYSASVFCTSTRIGIRDGKQFGPTDEGVGGGAGRPGDVDDHSPVTDRVGRRPLHGRQAILLR